MPQAIALEEWNDEEITQVEGPPKRGPCSPQGDPDMRARSAAFLETLACKIRNGETEAVGFFQSLFAKVGF